MPRFFINEVQIKEDTIEIIGEDVRHLKVFRYKVNDIIYISDMCRYDYECRISKIYDDKVIAEILSKKENDSEPKIKVTIYGSHNPKISRTWCH